MAARSARTFVLVLQLAVFICSATAHDNVAGSRRSHPVAVDGDANVVESPLKRQNRGYDMDDLVADMEALSLRTPEDLPPAEDQPAAVAARTEEPRTHIRDSAGEDTPPERAHREAEHQRILSEMTSVPNSYSRPFPENDWIPGGVVPSPSDVDSSADGDDASDTEHTNYKSDGPDLALSSQSGGDGSSVGTSSDSSDSGDEAEKAFRDEDDAATSVDANVDDAVSGLKCPAKWSRVCMKILQDDDSDDYLSGADLKEGRRAGELCERHLMQVVLSEEDKVACISACKARMQQHRAVLSHQCQYENNKWRRPSLGEAILLCSENQFRDLLGADKDKVWGGVQYPGWQTAKDPRDALSYAFEKESSMLTFLNLYRPEWFPEEIWDDDDRMCARDTRRCVPPFCHLQSGIDKNRFRTFKPCISNNWQLTGGSVRWINSDGSADPKKNNYPGLARVFSCTHRKEPLEGLRCLRSSARKMDLNKEEKQKMLSGYRWFMVKKAIKACIVGGLDMKCDSNGDFVNNVLGSRPLGDLMLYEKAGWSQWWPRLVKSQEELRFASGCRQEEPFMTAGTESCLLNNLSIHRLGDSFFDGDELYAEWAPEMKTMYHNIKSRERWFLKPIAEDEKELVKDCSLPSSDPSWTPDKQNACLRKYEMDGLQALRFMTPQVLKILEEIYSETSLQAIHKLRKEENLLTVASYTDYVIHVPTSPNLGYESLRGQPAMGWLPDRLIDENERSWEINHRKCTPSFSMLMSQVAAVQTAFGNTKNLHIHVVFPRPPSDRCDCSTVYSEEECIETMQRYYINPKFSIICRAKYGEMKRLRSISENVEPSDFVKMSADRYRVNEMLAALAAHLNDYEAVGNWHANMKTRYLTVWDNNAVERLKLLLAADVLDDLESKTGGHSWGLYKNAFMALRHGIYGNDVIGMPKIGFEFRALTSKLGETQLKILTSSKAKLKDNMDKIDPYDVALYLQKVVDILMRIKDSSAQDIPVRVHNSKRPANVVTLGQINEYQIKRRRVGMWYFGMYPRAGVDYGRRNYEEFVSYCLGGDEEGEVDTDVCVRSSEGTYYLREFVSFVVKVLATDENLAKDCRGEGANEFAARFIGKEEEALNQNNADWDGCLYDLLKRWSFVALGGAEMEALLRPKSGLKLQKKTWESTMEKFFLNPLVLNCDPQNKDTTAIAIKKGDDGYNKRIAYAFKSRSYTLKAGYSQCYRLWMGYVEYFHSWDNIEPYFME